MFWNFQCLHGVLCMAVNARLVTDIRYSHGFYRRMSNGETESAKTMLVEDSESEQAITPSKDGTLVIRQVRGPLVTLGWLCSCKLGAYFCFVVDVNAICPVS